MVPSRRWSSWFAAVAVLSAQAAWLTPASAEFLLNTRYSGVVTEISDQYGIFGPVAAGDAVEGILRFTAPTGPPDFQDPTVVAYTFPVTPGGSLMTARLGALDLRSTGELFVHLDHFDDPDFMIYGYDFQFIDGDVSLLNTSGLPAGYTLSFASAYVGLFATDPATLDFPNLPSDLLPLEGYDPESTGGLFSVQIRDANGVYVESAFLSFRLTGLRAVPEPSTALMVGAAAPLIAAYSRRRRTGLNRRTTS